MDLPPTFENFVARWALALSESDRGSFRAEAAVLHDEVLALAERARLEPSDALLFDVRRVLSMAREGLWSADEVRHTLDTLIDAKDTEADRKKRLMALGDRLSATLLRSRS